MGKSCSKKNRKNMKGFHIKNLFLRDKKKQTFLIVVQAFRENNSLNTHFEGAGI